MEELLNKLISKWWKPRWEEKIHSCRYYEEEKKFKADYTIAWIPQVLYRSIRELCSREAGLWQFVCENKLITNSIKMREAREHDIDDYNNILKIYDPFEYEYRLIESALCDEDKLEDFILSNIKVDEN